MPVSDSDRAFFERIGAYKTASHDEARARHLALSMDERLERSWQLSRQYLATTQDDRRDDDPSAFYARARALGLYIP